MSFLNTSNDYSNMTYQKAAKNVSSLTVSGTAKIKKQQNYITRFGEVARTEMKKYDIPASITLAQGLIESNAGDSPLSIENNNHFGMKCFSKSCHKGHCSNFTDDSHKDFFRKYETAWESFRAHSIMLGGERYVHLKQLKKSDYKGWANGLQKAGYATDKRYAEKLIHIIEEMELYQFDR
jgi:flagellum-specific peptidoglycan hydrolase FlgJ